MVAVRNVRESEFKKVKDQQRTFATAAPQNRQSNSYGRQRFIGGELLGEAGAQQTWHGNADFDGDVTISLTLTVGGNTIIIGTTTIGGTTTIEGLTLIKDSLKVEDNLEVTAETLLKGLVKLSNSMEVGSGGSVLIQGAIDMLLESGVITYANGATIAGSAGGITVDSGGGAQMQVSSAVASISSGANSMRSEGTGNVVDGVTDFQNDVISNGEMVLNDTLDANGLPSLPIAGAVSGTLVRLPGGNQVYVAV